MMIVALCAGFASCSNDDDDFDAANLVGTWQATHSEGWEKDAEYPQDDREWNGSLTEEDVYTMTFKADGTGIDGQGDAMTWKLDGDVLTINDRDDTVKVLKLTKNELVIEDIDKDDRWDWYSKDTFKKVK